MTRKNDLAYEARMQLVNAGGRAAQDLGFGRIPGQVVVYLYLSDGERSLARIESDLGLSKAAASNATRQLESMGLVKRCWKQGDRKVYYRTADNLGEVFRDGLVAQVHRKVESIKVELAATQNTIRGGDDGSNPELRFLTSRIERAQALGDRLGKLLNSRILRYLAR